MQFWISEVFLRFRPPHMLRNRAKVQTFPQMVICSSSMETNSIKLPTSAIKTNVFWGQNVIFEFQSVLPFSPFNRCQFNVLALFMRQQKLRAFASEPGCCQNCLDLHVLFRHKSLLQWFVLHLVYGKSETPAIQETYSNVYLLIGLMIPPFRPHESLTSVCKIEISEAVKTVRQILRYGNCIRAIDHVFNVSFWLLSGADSHLWTIEDLACYSTDRHNQLP